jgi:nicotinate-nucleotide adenylyltransferase
MSEPGAVGVMGGTFDPIHHGHLVAASEVAERFGLAKVLFVPTGRPWQKEGGVAASAEHRYLMTVIATAPDERFFVSRTDIDRPGPTYSVDTLTDLASQHKADTRWFFITGADALAQILTWRDYREILNMAHIVGVSRPGHGLISPSVPEGSVTLLEVPTLAISSTEVRDRVRSSRSIKYLVPAGVERYIAKTGLYSDRP